MVSLRQTIVAIGALDLAYVVWIALNLLCNSGLAGLWQSTVAFGLPFPELQVAAILAVYLAILVCGLAMLACRFTLAWLNYVLFPLRLLLVIPTLFPLFFSLSASGLVLHPGIAFALLFITEALRLILVYRWSRQSRAGAKAAGAAA